jgi:hypothetical protein
MALLPSNASRTLRLVIGKSQWTYSSEQLAAFPLDCSDAHNAYLRALTPLSDFAV